MAHRLAGESAVRLPDFLIIGAAKSGTSSLYRWLAAHPQVFMSARKETNYFAWSDGAADGAPADRFPIRSPQAYHALFEAAGDALAVGEASPRYLITPSAPARIAAELPEARLVACLRHPVERALSGYWMQVRKGRIAADPSRAFDRSDPFVAESFYARNLGRYFEHFDRDRVHVLLFDDLQEQPADALAALCAFLGVDPTVHAAALPRANAGWVPGPIGLRLRRSSALLESLAPPGSALRRAVAPLVKRTRRRPPEVPVHAKQALARLFEEDIEATAGLIGRDLGAWQRRYTRD